MNGEQKILRFRSSQAAAQLFYFTIRAFETAPNRWTVGSITPEEYYAVKSAVNIAAWESLYLPFQIGKEYTKNQMTDWCTTFSYSLTETSPESNSVVIHQLDIGTTNTPSAGSITASGATISWTNTNATKNNSIIVEISTDAGVTYTKYSTESASATSKAITGLTTGTAYRVRISPANASGVSTGLSVAFTTS